MLSQTTEPEQQAALPNEQQPMLIVTDIGGQKHTNKNSYLHKMAFRSMQIAEARAKQNHTAAARHQAELQRLIQQYSNQ